MSRKESENEINLMLKRLQKDLAKAEKSTGLDKLRKYTKRVDQNTQLLVLMLESYQLEFGGGNDKKNVKRFSDGVEPKIEKIRYKLGKLKTKKKEKKLKMDSDRLSKRKDAQKMQKKELIAYGDKMQEEGLRVVKRIERELEEDNVLVADVNQELYRQQEQLLVADELALEMESGLKRAGRYIAHFSHEYYKDKFFRVMVIVILLVLLSIMIIVYYKKSVAGGSNSVNPTPSSRSEPSPSGNSAGGASQVFESF